MQNAKLELEVKVRLVFEVAKSISKTLRQCAGIGQQQQQTQLLLNIEVLLKAG